MDRVDTIIIGAGAAGLSAACALTEAGERPLVLEARSRLGGRILTEEGAAPIALELGAEFVHGRGAEVAGWAKHLGLSVYKAVDRSWLFIDGKLQSAPDLWDRISGAMARLEPHEGDDDRLVRDLEKEDPLTRKIVTHFINGFHAAPVSEVSRRSLAHAGLVSDQTGDDDTMRLREGYHRLVAGIAQAAREKGATIRLRSPVEDVVWEPGRVEITVRGEGGKSHVESRRVVITIPLSLLRQRFPGPGVIRFMPPLVEKTRAFDQLGMGSVSRVLLQFRERFWEEKSPGLGFVHAPDEAFPTWWTAAPVDYPLLVAWAGGPKAEPLRPLGPDELRDTCLDTLGRMFAKAPAVLGGLLASLLYHDWDTDPYARGAYSYTRPGGADGAKLLAAPVADTLFFAGEATHFEGQSGTVEGALKTGRRVAKEILSSMGKEKEGASRRRWPG